MKISVGHAHAGQRGQAAIEVIGLLPAMITVGFVLLQLMAVGYASVLVGGAAEAGALALAAGADPRAGVKEALPGWSESRARIAVSGGEVEVHLRPPSLLHALTDRLEVSAESEVEQP